MERHPVIPGAEAWSSGGDGPGVLIVHGFSGNPVSTRRLGEDLAGEGFAVEVVRLPGHGTSWRDMARTRYPDWRVAADRAFERLASRVGPTVIAGLSMGGTIALDVAASRCRSGASANLAGVVAINAQVLDRDDPVSKLAPLLQWVLPVVPAPLAGITVNDIAKGGDEKAYSLIPSKSGYSFTRELPRIRRDLPEVDVPVLVANSPQDHTVPEKNSRAISELVGSEDVTELTLERSYHVATMDHDAELLTEEIAAFVRRVVS